MPQMPKWIGDAFESLLSNVFLPTTVVDSDMISGAVKWVRFKGNFSKTAFHAGYAVAFRVSDTAHRNYTPTLFDPEKGICDIIFHVHKNGPGSEFAAQLTTGDQWLMVPPRGRKFLQTDTPAGRLATLPVSTVASAGPAEHLFFGDETSLGLYALLAREITARGERFTAFLELDETNDAAATSLLGPHVHIVRKAATLPGSHAIACLQAQSSRTGLLADHCTAYLTGNGHAIQAFRKTLKTLPVTFTFKTEAYWIAGKKGL